MKGDTDKSNSLFSLLQALDACGSAAFGTCLFQVLDTCGSAVFSRPPTMQDDMGGFEKRNKLLTICMTYLLVVSHEFGRLVDLAIT